MKVMTIIAFLQECVLMHPFVFFFIILAIVGLYVIEQNKDLL